MSVRINFRLALIFPDGGASFSTTVNLDGSGQERQSPIMSSCPPINLFSLQKTGYINKKKNQQKKICLKAYYTAK